MTNNTISNESDLATAADRAFDVLVSNPEVGRLLDQLTASSLGRDIPTEKDDDTEWWDRFSEIVERLLRQMINLNAQRGDGVTP